MGIENYLRDKLHSWELTTQILLILLVSRLEANIQLTAPPNFNYS